MANEVVIKSNRYGVNLVLDAQMPFPELLQAIGEKFRETGSFFRNAKMAVSFEGRELTEREKNLIVKTIMENSSIQVVCIMEQGNRQEEQMKRQVEAFRKKEQQRDGEAGREEQVPSDMGDFYKCTLRSGQTLECASNVTLIGDVNPGARIIAGGNIVVLGSLKGNACAGAAGDNSCFIFALDMRPLQLQIGEYIAKSPDRHKEAKRLFKKEKELPENDTPQVAVVREGNICIEPMKKGCLDAL